MGFNWFPKKEKKVLPEFYLKYKNSFLNTNQTTINETRFVAFDTETTGFSATNDRVLSIGAISLKDNIISINDSFEVYIEQEFFRAETVPIHGILKKGEIKKISEISALKQFLEYINNAVLVGHHIGFDVRMINAILKRNKLPKLLNKTVDTCSLFKKSKHIIYQNDIKHYSLDDLCDELNIPKSDRHTASGDAYITAIAFLKIVSRLKKLTTNLKMKNILS